jgi:hypothetical protein
MFFFLLRNVVVKTNIFLFTENEALHFNSMWRLYDGI